MDVDGLESIAGADPGWWACCGEIREDGAVEREYRVVCWGVFRDDDLNPHRKTVSGLVHPSAGDGIIDARSLPDFFGYAYKGERSA